MLDHLKENYGNRQGINTNERMELEFLRKEVPALKSQLRSYNPASTQSDEHDSSEESSEAEEHVVDLPNMKV